uniref:C2HC zinc finger plants domain-containing protein n=1 Tax=Noccaea caerulescens TaxID=107243 RepID=A0A1J3JEY9_NOCCA
MHYAMNGDHEAEMNQMMETDSGETFILQKPDTARDFLSAARRLVDRGEPSQALQAVVMAMRTQGGDEAVLQVLNRTRELYKRRIQETASMDQLASIFAECAITEALPLGHHEPTSTDSFGTKETVTADSRGISILEKSGRSQIMLDAFADGSSFICLQCGGLVSIHRRDEHYAYWCSNM